MYLKPSRRTKKKGKIELNLVSILDAVFIFIFFLLYSVSFIRINEIESDVPIVSVKEPPKDLKPLALTLKITDDRIVVFTGIPSRQITSFGKTQDGEYDVESLHMFLVDLKKKNLKENSIILEPVVDLNYEVIVKLMDTVRVLRFTDEAIYVPGKDGINEKLKVLFPSIVFGNIQS